MMLLQKHANGINIWIGQRLLRKLRSSITKGLENMERNKLNPVAKNINKFNKPDTHTDRKKAMKKGYEKHRGAVAQ